MTDGQYRLVVTDKAGGEVDHPLVGSQMVGGVTPRNEERVKVRRVNLLDRPVDGGAHLAPLAKDGLPRPEPDQRQFVSRAAQRPGGLDVLRILEPLVDDAGN